MWICEKILTLAEPSVHVQLECKGVITGAKLLNFQFVWAETKFQPTSYQDTDSISRKESNIHNYTVTFNSCSWPSMPLFCVVRCVYTGQQSRC
jgi:hypothetical protein